MNISNTVLIFFMSLALQAQIVFYDYEDAQILTEEKNIGMFIEVCSSKNKKCRKLREEVFSDPEIYKIINMNFVNVRIDPNTEPVLAKLFEIKSIPALIFINKEGEEVDRIVGYKDASQTSKAIKSNTRKITGINALRKNYLSQKKDNIVLKEYYNTLKGAGFFSDARRLLTQYFYNIGNQPTSDELGFILNSADHFRTQSFKYILENLTQFDTTYKISVISNQLLTAFLNGLDEDQREDDIYVERRMKSVFRDADYQRFWDAYVLSYFADYIEDADVRTYSESGIRTLKRLNCSDSEYSNNLSVKLILKIDDHVFLKRVKKELMTCFEKTQDIASLDLISVITYKLGEKEEAIKMVQQATKMAFDLQMKFESSLRYFKEIGFIN